jgi:putative transposase
MIQELAEAYSVKLLCQVLECLRSTFYYRTQPRDDSRLQDAIEEVAGAWPTYGYRRITAQIRRDRKWAVNSKRVRRIMHLMRLPRRSKRRRRRTTNSDHPFPRYPNLVQDLVVTHPEQVWVADTLAPALQVQVSPTSV